ncbi:MAG: SusC/RagA family TonB-linked outer membrane protein [Parafilimonas sp.]
MLTKKLKLKINLLFALLLVSAITFAQSTLSGKVSNEKGEGLPAVTITAKGTASSTVTDNDGNFSLTVPQAVKFIIVSSVGFSDQEISVQGKASVNVVLQENVQSLNDVVVVGYGTARRKDVTGAVANISSKDFSTGVINNPMQQIQGKVSGLVITQPGGDPNANLIIRLRGQTSLTGGQTPLIVLDGIPLDDPNQISDIPPGDIASYDVLKDVSATAIYGARGANGVIIVNTKKGAAGRMQVNYNGYVGVDALAGSFHLLNTEQWKQASLDAGVPQATIDQLDHGANTDWLKAITRTAFSQSHNVSITGGSNGFNYNASVNYIHQDGLVINSGKNLMGLRFNAEQKALNDKLDINVSLSANEIDRKYVNYTIFRFINVVPPTFPVTDSSGGYYHFLGFDEQNPVEYQNLTTNTGKESLVQLYARVDYELLKGLRIGTLGSLSYDNLQTQYFQPTFPVVDNINNGSQRSSNVDSKKGDIHINYLGSFGKHNISLTGVYEYNQFTNSNFSASGRDFLVGDLGSNFLGGGNPSYNIINSYKEQYTLISFLGRAAYNYNQKYYATVSFRRDGSSKFGVNNRWGNFPSASIAWRLTQENFMKNISWLNELKINAGVGVVGNQDAINPYNTLLTLAGGTRYYNPSNPAYSYPQSYSPNQNQNADLKWEERHGANIGIDFAMFNNRFSGSINGYNDKTKNLLFTYSVPVPPYFVPTILANVGDLTNKGVDIQLNGTLIQQKKFSWNVSGQITFVKTKVTSLSGTYNGTQIASDLVPVGYANGRGYASNAISFLKVGYSPYIFYLPEFAGLSDTISASSNSNQLYYTEDGKTTPNTGEAKKKFIDPTPNFTYGFSSTFTYSDWSFNFFLRGVQGQKLFNNYDNLVSNVSRLPGNNITTSGLTNGIKGSQTASDYWLQNASYLRLDNATLAYTFRNMKKIQSLRFYVTGTNLFVITPYTGMDPEITTGNSNQAYIDDNYSVGFYPRSRSFIFGVNVSFK